MNQTEPAFAVPEEQKQKIINDILPQLLSIFGRHAVKIISFNHDDLSYINLAILVKDYNTELYKKDVTAVHAVTDLINTDICILSGIVIDYKTVQKHVLFPEIDAGTEIYKA